MKHILLKLLFAFVATIIAIPSLAQIEIRTERVAPKEIVKPAVYDSLTNIHIDKDKLSARFVKKEDGKNEMIRELYPYIGQKVLFLPDTERNKERNKNTYKLPIENLKGKYYTIKDIECTFSSYSDHIDDIIFTLQAEDSTSVRWSSHWNFFEISENFMMLVGYYEKLKSQSVGKTFVYSKNIKSPYNNQYATATKDVNTGELVKLVKGGKWTCTALQLVDDDYFMRLYYVFTNDKGNEIMVRQEDSWKTDDEINVAFFNAFKEKSVYERDLLAAEVRAQKIAAEKAALRKADEQRRAANIAKYGAEIGGLINAEKVRIGMTAEMCRASWGSPYEINTTITAGGRHEQWVYSMKTYLYFDNGILTGIQN